MTTIILAIAAVIGWALFLFMVVLYRVGNRENAVETNSLAIYGVALALSDDFRNPIRVGIAEVIREAHSKKIEPEKMAFGLMQAVTKGAKRYNEDTTVNSLSIVLDQIRKNA